ncbi:MAG: hypothetical protein ACMUIU_20070 [bacterium]
MIKFKTASTCGFPVLIKKSAIITPAMVVIGVNGTRVVTADTEAIGFGFIAGVVNVAGNIGTGFK